MRTNLFIKLPVWVICISIFSVTACSQSHNNDERIQPYKANPYYWQYDGKPVVLLGGSKDDNLFQLPDLKQHLQEIAGSGGNYIRNTMSDRPDRGHEVYPFKELPDGKYDLDQWNEEYWQRFKNLLRRTSEMDIIVQIEVWDRFDYSRDNWGPHPYNPGNNINYTYEESRFEEEYPQHPGANVQPFFFTTPRQQNNTLILRYQQKFVDKLLELALAYPNILFCIDNETSGEEAWSVYWAEFIRKQAEEKGVRVNITEMWDEWDLKEEQHLRTFDHPDRFDFVDISQNNHQTNETHWQNFLWVRDYLGTRPRPMNSVKIYGADGGRHGGNDRDAVEKFWRLIFAGAASARFHRPSSGIGLSETAQIQLRSARTFLDKFNIVDANPDSGHELLFNREEDEAYLSHIDHKQYAVFFPDGGDVRLNLPDAGGNYDLEWLDISASEWREKFSVNGEEYIMLKTPDSGYWIALLTRK